MNRRPPSILDPGFRYVRSGDTDIRKTFARVKREEAKRRLEGEQTPEGENVVPIREVKRVL